MKNIFFFCTLFILLFLSLFLSNCANRIPPTGGPKDTLSPQLKFSIPENQSLNYKGKEMILSFDEWIKEENFRKELLITPSIGVYKYRIVKKKLIIDLPDSLGLNTTYNFNFRNCIKDITEGNKINDIVIAFSTGDYLDTMKLGGMVTDLLTNTPVKEVLVGLYPLNDTIQIKKDKPTYFTFTTETGAYLIQNIKKDVYQLFAFEDKNSDFLYQEEERMAFLPERVDLNEDNLDTLGLKILREDHTPPKLIREQKDKHYFQLGFDEGLKKISISELGGENIDFQGSETGRDFKIYNNIQKFDSIRLHIIAEDSLGNISMDTIKMKFAEFKEDKPKDPFEFKLTLEGGSGIDKRIQFAIKFSKPVKDVFYDKILYIKDQPKKIGKTSWSEQLYLATQNKKITKQPLSYNPNTYQWNENRTELKVDTLIPIKETFDLIMPQGTFISIEQDTSSAYNEIFPLKDPKKIGSISGIISTQTKIPYILQLVSEKLIVKRELKNPLKFDFEFLDPGTYTLRVILDENNNGKWDGPDLRTKSMGEKIILYNQLLKLREGWDIQGEEFIF